MTQRKVKRGKELPQTKLTDENVAGIRQAKKDGSSNKMLAVIYGVSESQISRITRGNRRQAARATND